MPAAKLAMSRGRTRTRPRGTRGETTRGHRDRADHRRDGAHGAGIVPTGNRLGRAFLTPSQTAAVAGTDKMCAPPRPIRASASDWPILGLDENSTRYQPNPGLKAADVPRLKVKWAFSMTGGGQPIVIGDWLFITNRGGKFYALDAKSGCVHWAIDDASSRTTPMVVRSSISPSGWATFIGVGKRVVRAFDAQSGRRYGTANPWRITLPRASRVRPLFRAISCSCPYPRERKWWPCSRSIRAAPFAAAWRRSISRPARSSGRPS